MAKLTFDSEFNSNNIGSVGQGQPWEYSFDYAPNGFADSSMSSYEVNPNAAGLPADANVYNVGNGLLTMQIKNTPSDVPGNLVNNEPFLSGQINTKNEFSQTHGYFEARMQVPTGAGTSSAFWAVPQNGAWPPELDMPEFDQSPTYVNWGIHGVNNVMPQNTAASNQPDASTGMHVYGVDWEADKITFYEDGKEISSAATPANMNTAQYLILDDLTNAPGGWNGSPAATINQSMKVDYVRAYASDPYASGLANPDWSNHGTTASTYTPTTDSGGNLTGFTNGGAAAPQPTPAPSAAATTPQPTPASATPTTTPTTTPIGSVAASSQNGAAGVVKMNLAAPTGQIVHGTEFGLSTSMGDGQHDYKPYGDPSFTSVADQYPVDLLRHNWELNTFMDQMFPSRGSASSPNFTNLDNYLNNQPGFSGFFNAHTGTQVVTLGVPSWMNISSAADQQLYGQMVAQIAQHFAAKGDTGVNWDLINEPDGHENITDLANIFNVAAKAIKAVDPTAKTGGLAESWYHSSDLGTFEKIAGQNIDFLSWHQYDTTGGMTPQQEVNAGMSNVQQNAKAILSQAVANGVNPNVKLFMGEYNVDAGNYNAPDNGNMVGAVNAAAVTYGMINSNSNVTMGALWETLNDGSYNVFGAQGNYKVDPVGVTLSALTQYMPGNLVQTTTPGNDPGLVGYTTTYNGGFSTALVNTNLSNAYTVDMSNDGLPTSGLEEIQISNAHPMGAKTAITDLSKVQLDAGSITIITNEAPHIGEYNGGAAPASGTTGATATTTPTPATTAAAPPSSAPPSLPAATALTSGQSSAVGQMASASKPLSSLLTSFYEGANVGADLSAVGAAHNSGAAHGASVAPTAQSISDIIKQLTDYQQSAGIGSQLGITNDFMSGVVNNSIAALQSNNVAVQQGYGGALAKFFGSESSALANMVPGH